MTEQRIYELDQIPTEARILIYGCGERGRDLRDALSELRPDVRVIGFGDSFKSGEQDGLPVMTPDTFGNNYDLILIASAYEEDILAGLDPALLKSTYVADRAIVIEYNISKLKHPRFCNISVELTTHCNMACEYCVHRVSPRKNHVMPLADFESVLDKIVRYNLTNELMLSGLGEPLLYPHYDDAVRLAKNTGLTVNSCTNGLLFNSEKYGKLVDAGLDMLCVSLHDLRKESFVYRGAKNKKTYNDYFTQIMGGIEYHMQRKPDTMLEILLTFSKPEDPVSSLWGLEATTYQGSHGIELFNEFANRLEDLAAQSDYEITIDREVFKTLFEEIHTFGINRTTVLIGHNLRLLFSPIVPAPLDFMKVLRPEKLGEIRHTPSSGEVCPGAGYPMITHNGDTYPCCTVPMAEDDSRSLCLGNIHESENPLDVFDGDKARNFFKNMKRGIFTCGYCATCRSTYSFR